MALSDRISDADRIGDDQSPFGLSKPDEDGLTRTLTLQGLAEQGIPEDEREPGQQMQVGPRRRADDREEGMHGLAVEGPVLEGLLKEAQGDGRAVDVEHDGVTYMRDGNTIADRRRRKRFTGQ